MQWEPWRQSNLISRHIKSAFTLLVFWFQQTAVSTWRDTSGHGSVLCFLMRQGTRKGSFHKHNRLLLQWKGKTHQKVCTVRWTFLHKTTSVWCWLTWRAERERTQKIKSRKRTTHTPENKLTWQVTWRVCFQCLNYARQAFKMYELTKKKSRLCRVWMWQQREGTQVSHLFHFSQEI